MGIYGNIRNKEYILTIYNNNIRNNKTIGRIGNYCMCMPLHYVSGKLGNRGNIIHMALIQMCWKEMMP